MHLVIWKSSLGSSDFYTCDIVIWNTVLFSTILCLYMSHIWFILSSPLITYLYSYFLFTVNTLYLFYSYREASSPNLRFQSNSQIVMTMWCTTAMQSMMSLAKSEPLTLPSWSFVCFIILLQTQAPHDPIMTSLVFLLTDAPNPPTIAGYTEGKEVYKGSLQTLTCTCIGGNPPATLTWWKGKSSSFAHLETWNF